MANAPVPGTPKSSGAPKVAPSQTLIVTGKGENAKALDGHPTVPPLAPKPRAAPTTGPKGSQSVDYNSQQGNRIPADVGTAQHRIIVGEQDQQLQDKAGA